MQAKYINPFTDFGFKKIFGEEASKPLLLDFLNALLPPSNRIADISFKKNEQLGQTDADRKAIYDIYCENKGEKSSSSSSKRQNRTISRKGPSTTPLSPSGSRQRKASGTTT